MCYGEVKGERFLKAFFEKNKGLHFAVAVVVATMASLIRAVRSTGSKGASVRPSVRVRTLGSVPFVRKLCAGERALRICDRLQFTITLSIAHGIISS